MATGVCCHWLQEKTAPRSGKKELFNVFDEKTLQLGRYKQGKYTDASIKSLYVHNVVRLVEMLPTIHSAGISLFRISSAMFPLADQVDSSLLKNPEVASQLKKAGDFIKAKGMREICHKILRIFIHFRRNDIENIFS